MKKNPFEKSSKDVEKKGGPKEGSKKEEFMDTIQAKKGMKCGGKVKGKAAGGVMRGAGAAVKGKRFSRSS